MKYDDMLALLRVIRDHEAVTDKSACNPCDTTGLAQAMGLEPQEIADGLSAALARGRMITARKTAGATEPYFDQIRLSSNGRAAVKARRGESQEPLGPLGSRDTSPD